MSDNKMLNEQLNKPLEIITREFRAFQPISNNKIINKYIYE